MYPFCIVGKIRGHLFPLSIYLAKEEERLVYCPWNQIMGYVYTLLRSKIKGFFHWNLKLKILASFWQDWSMGIWCPFGDYCNGQEEECALGSKQHQFLFIFWWWSLMVHLLRVVNVYYSLIFFMNKIRKSKQMYISMYNVYPFQITKKSIHQKKYEFVNVVIYILTV